MIAILACSKMFVGITAKICKGDKTRLQTCREHGARSIRNNGILIGLAVFAQLALIPDTQTHTDYATCDMCNNRPHLMHCAQAMWLKQFNIVTFRLLQLHILKVDF